MQRNPLNSLNMVQEDKRRRSFTEQPGHVAGPVNRNGSVQFGPTVNDPKHPINELTKFINLIGNRGRPWPVYRIII